MAEIFRIELLPARHGDCILIEYGDARRPSRFLIDGGPIGAYPALERRLKALPPDERELELLVITHIDADHIEGGLKLLNHPELASFRDIWFNGWPHLDQPLDEPAVEDGLDGRTERSVLEGAFAKMRIGDRVWNGAFQGRPIFVPQDGALPRIALPGGMVLTLLSPRLPDLVRLRREWIKAMDRLGLDPDDARAIEQELEKKKRLRGAKSDEQRVLDILLGAQEVTGKVDDAVANGSSIAFLAEYAGRRCALLADAHTVAVEQALRRLVRQEGSDRVRLDALKLAHHGSAGNINASILALLECDAFLVSTDGSIFNHPDDDAIKEVVRRAPGARLFFNYLSERTAIWDREDLRGELGYSACFPQLPDRGMVFDLMARHPA